MMLNDINRAGQADFITMLGAIYEYSPWVAQRVWIDQPFATLDALAEAMQAVVRSASDDERMALIRAHPELAGKARIAELTAHSAQEQAGAGLATCTPAQFAALQRLNEAYRLRFGFPFIIAVKGHSPETIIAAMTARLAHDASVEQDEAIAQIGRIARLRLQALLHQD